MGGDAAVEGVEDRQETRRTLLSSVELARVGADDSGFGVVLLFELLDPKKPKVLLSEGETLRVETDPVVTRSLSFCSFCIAFLSRCSRRDSLSGSVHTTSHMVPIEVRTTANRALEASEGR